MRTLCAHNPKLGVALEVPASLASGAAVERWLGEPLRAVLLPTVVFLTNRKGFPVLGKPHQELLLTLFRHNVQVRAGQERRV